MSAMLPNAEWVNGVHVTSRAGGVTYVGDVIYTNACALVLVPR